VSIYIVWPKTSVAARSLALHSRKLAAASRGAQINEIFSLRVEDPVQQEIHHWVADAQSREVKPITKSEADTQITGTTIVEMPDEEAERMRQELPDVLVLRDGPVELIQPRRAETAARRKESVSARDLWHLKAIGLEAARKQGFEGAGAAATVAVLDTGIDATHPDLDGRVAGAYTFDVPAWEAAPMTPSQDTDGHGTHVAGLICGKKVGVAPGAEVLSGVMIPHGHGNISDIVLALEWVATRPEVQIVNMSAGIPGYVAEMRQIVADLIAAGVLLVCATGNEGRNRTRSPGNYIEPISVGATNRRNRVAGFSSGGTLITENHQYTVPDLVAPGDDVYSSVMGGGYEAWDGTSMATPIVSGVAALILEKYPEITMADLVEELLATCEDLGQSADRQGEGLVQVQATL
jgi:subtilisin family serine protease